ncbi:MAG TPA: amino acid ABC transporter substrate-binding protein [Pseudonocardiaceae bacterium]|nr:amino acid ABC transporter substrate-binding protein [Pseudonocardiaceae bacterium]
MGLRSLFGRSSKGAVVVRPRWWRYRYAILALVLVVLAGIAVWFWKPWQQPPAPCGAGLTPVGSPQVCAGLDLDSTPFRPDDPLADLERAIADQNAQISTDRFVTVVMLDDLSPDPASDSVAFQTVRHGVQGAITGAWQADNETTAAGKTPPVKLLLANLGSGGDDEQQAVDAIIANRDKQHIVAVTDFGQSLITTRKAASDLSNAGIAGVGSLVTGDDMNQYPNDGDYIQNFFRVGPTNTDAATAAVGYIASHGYQKVMLVDDTNKGDDYASSLAQAFRTAYASQYQQQPLYSKEYPSPNTPLNDIGRTKFMQSLFGQMYDEICLAKPNLIYFAGRGVDLSSFLVALSQGGSCGLGTVDVMSGDDATAMLTTSLPHFTDPRVQVFYTGLATIGEWDASAPGEADDAANYQAFLDVFTGKTPGSPGFGVPADLVDGYVIMNHDAVLTAATAARQNPAPVDNPTTVAGTIASIDCLKPIPGAGGKIAFSSTSHGNPVDKPLPIMQITGSGPVQRDLVWSVPGAPFDPALPECR